MSNLTARFTGYSSVVDRLVCFAKHSTIVRPFSGVHSFSFVKRIQAIDASVTRIK